MKPRTFILFIAIFLLGVVFRFYQLGAVPASLNWDEVSWGYNAYSIAQTGKDEYGTAFPLSFKAFGDYKQPVYVYLDALPIKLWGLTAFAVRFPSALLGSLTVLSVFLLTRELFSRSRHQETLSLLVMFLFAVSPWSIQFSRVAFEANVGIFFTITGAWLYLFGLRKENPWFLGLAAVVMSVSCYTYHSQKLFTPFLFLVLLAYGKDYFLRNRRVFVLLLLVFFLANIVWAFDMRTTARGRSVLFTSHQTEILAASAGKLQFDREQGDRFGQLLHNRRFVYLDKYIENYLLHFEPNFLFLKGDNPRHHPPFMGVLYLIALPFLLFGMIRIIQKEKRPAVLLFAWLLLAPIASSLAVDAPNASRSMVFLPTWDIFTGYGLLSFFLIVKIARSRTIALAAVVVLYSLQILYYAHNYFAHTDTLFARDWQYGYKEAVLASSKTSEPVVFGPDIEQPYIFYLFYTRKDPAAYLAEGGSEKIAEPCFSIDHAYFGRCLDSVRSGYLVTAEEPGEDLHAVKEREIRYPDGEVALTLYQFSRE
jgi:4-amino-4-deoxy-L-arabinose transferase-like glycosyltransferase